MDVNVGSKAVITMPKPGLDILHGIAEIKHDRGAAMAQIMEADWTQTVFDQQLLEFLAHEVRLE